VSKAGTDQYEQDADCLAAESLIPQALWEEAQLTEKSTTESVVEFSEQIRVSPAIPAGRIRYETGNYRRFKSLVGAGQVKPMFGFT
jgi:HTH-type transcriptional regulator/antitoxin HigA